MLESVKKGVAGVNRILIVEDEQAISDLIKLTLNRAGYRCEVANDGDLAADLFVEHTYDLVLLDVMLPGANGYELMEYIAPSGVPVIFITAKSAVQDRVYGLHLGADDYIVKPFDPQELAARVEAVLRRAGKGTAVLHAFGAEIDTVARRVWQQGNEIFLTPREFDLLEILLRNRGMALYRETLFEQVWGGEREEGNRTLDLHILRLRQKLGWKDQIRTVFKIGYMLEKE